MLLDNVQNKDNDNFYSEDLFDSSRLESNEHLKLETNIKKSERISEDDTSIVDEEDSIDCQSLIDTFKFERGLKLILEIPKETIRYKYNDKLEKHIQLPSLISFRDLCISIYGEENIIEKKVTENKKKWDNIIKEKNINEIIDKDETEENERTYEDITSFLDTINSNNKSDSTNSNENVLRKRVHEMSTRLSKQGLLCDPREYYFNPMTMSGGNGMNRSREDYYDVYDDFIDDSELVDDLGLSLEEIYNRNEGYENHNLSDDTITTNSIQTSDLIYADYKNPNAFYCDDNPQNDLVDFYYDSSSISSEDFDKDEYGDEININNSQELNTKEKSISLRDILSNPVIKLLIQLKTDCWLYYSSKNNVINKDFNENNSNISSTPVTDHFSSSQATAEITTPIIRECVSTFTFPQRTPKVVTEWFKALNEKLKLLVDSYTKCKHYYNNHGNIRYEKNFVKSEIQDPLSVLMSNIERDPILCRIPSLFSSIYKDYKDVVPFDSKLILVIWEALNKLVPSNNKKPQFNLVGNSTVSNAIVQILTKFDNFRSKWARMILNHNQEALYQFDLNAYESIINYPLIKSKSPIYIKKILDAISQYNLLINNSKDQENNESLSQTCDQTITINTPLLNNVDELNKIKICEENIEKSQSEKNFACESTENFIQNEFENNTEIPEFQNETQNKTHEKKTKNQDLVSQNIKAVNCELVFDYGISLLEYIHGINRLKLVYKEMISANVMTKAIQKEQENIPVNGTKGLELMIKNYILKRFSSVNFEGQKLKDIPHRFFLNQIKLMQLKYNYKSLTTITARRPKSEAENLNNRKKFKREVGEEQSELKIKQVKTNLELKNLAEKGKKRTLNLTTDSNLFSKKSQKEVENSKYLEADGSSPKFRKSRKLGNSQGEPSPISLSDTSGYSQNLMETPHFDAEGTQMFNATEINNLKFDANYEGINEEISLEKIVQRKICGLQKMTSYTINEVDIESSGGR